MSARRLKGYVVKLPDGTRSEHTRRPVSLAYASAHLCDDGAVVPVFATRKPKPAPAEGAAEERYAVLRKNWGGNEFRDLHYGDDTRTLCHVGTRATVDESQRRVGPSKDAEVVRILPDGALEAACEAAAERGRIEALTSIRDACEFKADTVHDGPAMGLRMAMVLVDNAFKRLGEEKGQAK